MSTPVIAFFNNKGGVGKTSLVYHVAWMMSDLGLRVLVADLDPQGNLTSVLLDEERLEALWPEDETPKTIFRAIQPLKDGIGDIVTPQLELIDERLALIPGEMSLTRFEDDLSQVWPKCLDHDKRAFRVISAFWRVLQKGAEAHAAQVILVDLGPNLGAINRSALIAADSVVIPLAPDLFSLQGLRNLGPTLRDWRKGWRERLQRNPDPSLILPKGEMRPLGYMVMAHSTRENEPVRAYEKWIARIPETYHVAVLEESSPDGNWPSVAQDPHCFALLRHFRSLMPMAQEARKPIFHLKPKDGAIGSHADYVKKAYDLFKNLTLDILQRAGIPLPE
ncbi:MAG: AAA family ATPase [Magnetococcales bacterium]|nr:AAA family ATPase [Magnetococcales bacterium]